MKQIIAIGGAGFARSSVLSQKTHLAHYILSQTHNQYPKICFLSQASGESPEYVTWFYKTFVELKAQPSTVSLFGRVQPSWQQQLLEQDIIFVGGGNTRSMLALWREWGVDTVLRQAYEKGIILAGVSAGAICWFEQGITDSMWPLGVLQGLSLLPGSCCPHYDTEPERRPAYLTFTQEGRALPGIALQDDVAAHYIDGTLHQTVSIKEGKKAYTVAAGKETELSTSLLV